MKTKLQTDTKGSKRQLDDRDREILELTVRINALHAQFSGLPNGEKRERLWKKCGELSSTRSGFIYTPQGNFRADLRHLLVPGTGRLNVALLDAEPEQQPLFEEVAHV